MHSLSLELKKDEAAEVKGKGLTPKRRDECSSTEDDGGLSNFFLLACRPDVILSQRVLDPTKD